ncbi:MAG: ATP-binding protein, partial [Bacteroidia bacterium]|nr:ATP-binding protein [Bacteroidia bacterium]
MELTTVQHNAQTLFAEMQWLAKLIELRMKLYWNEAAGHQSLDELPPPDLSRDLSPYADLIRQ